MVTHLAFFLSVLFFFFLRFYLFIFRGEGWEKEEEKHQSVVASCAPPTGDPACHPSMCPDWESSQRPFGLQTGAQSTEPTPARVSYLFFLKGTLKYSGPLHRRELACPSPHKWESDAPQRFLPEPLVSWVPIIILSQLPSCLQSPSYVHEGLKNPPLSSLVSWSQNRDRTSRAEREELPALQPRPSAHRQVRRDLLIYNAGLLPWFSRRYGGAS